MHKMKTVLFLFLFFYSFFILAQPANDNCSNATLIPIGQNGYQVGKFTSSETDITKATVENDENFYSTILTAGQTEKSIWYKFSIPTSRKCTFYLKQNGNEIPGNAAGFTVYLAKNCLPKSAQAEDAMLASQSVFGSSTYPCMKPGEYLVQISTLNSTTGKLFVELELDYPETLYDKPSAPYDFGVLTGNRCLEYNKVKLGCFSTDNTTEKCNLLGDNFTQTIWYSFTTDNYLDYVAFAYRFLNSSVSKKSQIGFRLFKGDSKTQPFSNLQEIGSCNTDLLQSNVSIFKFFSCEQIQPNTTYSIQITAEKDFTDEFELFIQKFGTKASTGFNPLKSNISGNNNLGVLTENTTSIQDYFSCNTRMKSNPCGNSTPATGLKTKMNNSILKYNIATWYTFELKEPSTLSISLKYPEFSQNPLIRIFKAQGINCNDIDTTSTLYNQLLINDPNRTYKIYCIPAGKYSLQILGLDSLTSNTQDFNYKCNWLNHLGQEIGLSISATKVQLFSNFSLNAINKFDIINKNNNTFSDLNIGTPYKSINDTVGCENTVRPDDIKCGNSAQKAVYNEFQTKDSGFVFLDVNWPFFLEFANWNKLYKGDANDLTKTQNKHLYPEKFNGLVDFSECFSKTSINCNRVATACITPGIYTHVNFFDSSSVTKPINTTYTLINTKAKFNKPETAEDLGDIIQKMGQTGSQKITSQKDYFTCYDNPYTIDGLAPCNGFNGANQKVKLSFRQFFLNKATNLRIIPKGSNNLTLVTYSLFTGKATDGISTLKRINSTFECTTDTLPCATLKAGWYTIVLYGEGPNYTNPLKNYYTDNDAGGEVGSQNYIELKTTPLRGQKYNLPQLACVDSITKQPFKLFTGKGGTLTNPKFDTTYILYPEYFNCNVDTPFYKHPVKPCDSVNLKRVAYYTINIMQESYIKLKNLPTYGKQDLICNIYKGNAKSTASILKSPPIQPCISGNFAEICKIQPGIYTLVIFIPDSYAKDSIQPMIYVDKTGNSLHDFAAKAYDFGLIPSDNQFHKGKTGDVSVLNPAFSPSTDGFYCSTGSSKDDPSHIQVSQPVGIKYVSTIYKTPPTNINLYSSNAEITTNYLPRRNIWYTFVLKGGGNCTVRMKGLHPTKPNVPLAVYKSNVDGKLDFKEVVKNKLVDSTLLDIDKNKDSLVLITNGINEVRFYRDVCNNKDERYYILAESEFDINYFIDCEILWALDDDNRTGDYCSKPVFGEVKQVGNLLLSANVTCHTIGESFGEDGSNMSCLIKDGANLLDYKSTWFRFDITGESDTFDISPIISNKTNIPSDNIRYRLLYGSCGAMNTGSCFVSANTLNVFECLIKGSYFLQVVTPDEPSRTEGIIDMNLKINPSKSKCSSVNPCLSMANMKPTSNCYTDTITFLNLSTAGDSIKYKWTFNPYNSLGTTVKNPKLVFPITNLQENVEVKLVTVNPICKTSDSITKIIIVNKKPKLKLGVDTILCYLKTLQLDITTHLGTSYLWDNGSTLPSRSIDKTGTYFAESSLGTCTVKDTIKVIVNPFPNPLVTLEPVSKNTCSNESLTLNTNATGNNGFKWQWKDTIKNTWNTIIDVPPFSGSNTNTLTINPVKGLNKIPFRSVATEPLNTCFTYSKETKISELPIPKIVELTDPFMKNDTVVRCQKDNVYTFKFDISNGTKPFKIDYLKNNTSFSQNTDKQFALNFTTENIEKFDISIPTITDANGCVIKNFISDKFVTIKEKPIFDFSTTDTLGCPTYEVQFNDSSKNKPFTRIFWDFGNSKDTTLASSTYSNKYTTPGVYTVKGIAEIDGCFDTIIKKDYITVVLPPIADFITDKTETDILNSLIEFESTSKGTISKLDWVFSDGSPIEHSKHFFHKFPAEINTYEIILTAFTSKDCFDSKTKTIKINDVILVYVPNSFTPNGDESNNVFLPVITSGIVPETYKLRIFNRWGELLFESSNINVGWDGSYSNKICPNGTYTWKIEFTDNITKDKHLKVGHINLIN